MYISYVLIYFIEDIVMQAHQNLIAFFKGFEIF